MDENTEEVLEIEATPPEELAVEPHECQYPDGLEHCTICGKPLEKPVVDAPPQAEIVSETTDTEIPTPPTEGVANEGTTSPTVEGQAIPTEVIPDTTPEIVTEPEVMPGPVVDPEDEEKNGGEVALPAEQRTKYRWWEGTDKLSNLQKAFNIGCDIGEACLYAQITREQYQYYQEKIDTNYSKKVKLWRESPTLIARQNIVDKLSTDADLALKYLERRKKDEFGLRTEVTASDGAPLQMVIDIVRQKQETVEE